MPTTMTALLCWLVLGTTAVAWGDDVSLARCSDGTAERLRFVEDRLEERRPYANYWWMGWTGFYGIGTVVSSVQAGTEGDEGKRADYVVSAVKASFGVGRLVLFPPTAKAGAAAMGEVAPTDESACRERLRIGEELMRTNARETASRWSWKRHAAIVGINLAGGLIVAEGFDEPRGWRSMGIGIGVGEIMTFSHPWKAEDDLTEYEQKFGATTDYSARKISFEVAPLPGGLAFGMRF